MLVQSRHHQFIKSNLSSPWYNTNLKIAKRLSFFSITRLLVTVKHKSLQTGTENPDQPILNKWSFVLIGHFSSVPGWLLNTSLIVNWTNKIIMKSVILNRLFIPINPMSIYIRSGYVEAWLCWSLIMIKRFCVS